MLSNSPHVCAWLDIPEDCRMEVELDLDNDLRFTLGDPRADGLHLAFERGALERFVQLANDALEIEQSDEPLSETGDRDATPQWERSIVSASPLRAT